MVTLNHIVYELFELDRNASNHTNGCKLFVIDGNTQYRIKDYRQKNCFRKVPQKIDTP